MRMTKADINKLKEATRTMTRWDSTGQAFGHIKNIKGKFKPYSMYEFFCLMKILEDLRTNYNIQLIKGWKDKKIFPQSPAPKEGWSYFIIQNKNDSTNCFQICYGTKIRLSSAPQTLISPDISIQDVNSTPDPDDSMVLLIMDAKCKEDFESSLSVELLHEFIQKVNALNTLGASFIDLFFNRLDHLKSNCLLTNGEVISKHDQYCKNNNVRMVGKFDWMDNTPKIVG